MWVQQYNTMTTKNMVSPCNKTNDHYVTLRNVLTIYSCNAYGTYQVDRIASSSLYKVLFTYISTYFR